MVKTLTYREREQIIRIYLINKYIKGLSHTRNPSGYSDSHLVALQQIVADENELFLNWTRHLLPLRGYGVVEVVKL